MRLGVDADRLLYFPSWAEEFYKVFPDPSVIQPPVALPEGFRVVFAGNVGAAQDFPTILGAAEILRERSDIQWIIIGDGRMKQWVENEVCERGLSETVHLIGSFPPEIMPRFFAHSDALLVSLKMDPVFSATIPGKVQSYLACERPIIAALDGEGARVIREAQAGIVCQTENSLELAQAVVKLSSMSEEERRLMGLSGREYYNDHFERNLLIDRLEEWMIETTAVC